MKNSQTKIKIGALLPLIGNFLKWMIPGIFVLIYCLMMLLVFSDGAPSHADQTESRFTSKLPSGMLSFLGLSGLLMAIFFFTLIVLHPKMDFESMITFSTIGIIGLLFGIPWTRKELKRISQVK